MHKFLLEYATHAFSNLSDTFVGDVPCYCNGLCADTQSSFKAEAPEWMNQNQTPINHTLYSQKCLTVNTLEEDYACFYYRSVDIANKKITAGRHRNPNFTTKKSLAPVSSSTLTAQIINSTFGPMLLLFTAPLSWCLLVHKTERLVNSKDKVRLDKVGRKWTQPPSQKKCAYFTACVVSPTGITFFRQSNLIHV